MKVAEALRNAHVNGTRAVTDLPKSWKLSRRRSRLRRRIFLGIGILVGVFVIATLWWGFLDREGR